MNYIVFVLVGLGLAVVALAIYVRLAPVRAEVWHAIQLPVGPVGELATAGSFTVMRQVEGGASVLADLDQIITQTPRTVRVAGSVADGKVTYVTRSRVFGFPDYTSVAIAQSSDGSDMGTITIFGRLRFGQSDLGVNRARIQGWLAQLDEGRP